MITLVTALALLNLPAQSADAPPVPPLVAAPEQPAAPPAEAAPAAPPAVPNPWPASLVGALTTALGGCLCGGLCVVPVVAAGVASEGWAAIALSPGVGLGALVGSALGSTLPALIWSEGYDGGDTFLIIAVPAVLTVLVAGSTALAAAVMGTVAGQSAGSDGELLGSVVGVAVIGGGLLTSAVVGGLMFGGLSLLVYGE